MSKMKKIVTLTSTYALVAALAIGGTVAYLKDQDDDTNVMMLGNVDIEQLEYERVVDENGDYVKGVLGSDFESNYGINESYKLKEFKQAKPAYPAVYQNGNLAWDEFQQLWNQVGAPGSNDLFDDSMKNVIDKFVFVKNTGKSDLYYRTIVAVEVPEGLDSKKVHLSMNTNNRFDAISGEGNTKSYHVGYTTIDGVRYSLYNMTYNQVLTPGEISRPSFLQAYLDPLTTNEECALFKDTWDILVVSQAVQTNGFNNANEALNTAFYEISENSHPWVDGVKIPVVAKNEETVANMLNILNNGQDIIATEELDLIYVAKENESVNVDAQGATVTLNGTGKETGNYCYLGFVPSVGEDAVVENLNVTGAGFVEVGHYGLGGGNYTINNVNIHDLQSTLGSVDGANKVSAAFAHYGTATLNDCTMVGTTTNYDGYKAYDLGCVNKTNTTINKGTYGSIYLWPQAHVTIKDAKIKTIDSAAITRNSLGMLTISAGTHVETINLVCDNKYKPALTIEDGATVDKIVYNGTTYTQAEWLSR